MFNKKSDAEKVLMKAYQFDEFISRNLDSSLRINDPAFFKDIELQQFFNEMINDDIKRKLIHTFRNMFLKGLNEGMKK